MHFKFMKVYNKLVSFALEHPCCCLHTIVQMLHYFVASRWNMHNLPAGKDQILGTVQLLVVFAVSLGTLSVQSEEEGWGCMAQIANGTVETGTLALVIWLETGKHSVKSNNISK